ncbi:MAG: DM13 domain-containing protein [Parcubacteria group bacterium]|nr:DM13 domain-containing protein [Parcubacteria group bacterium]
MKLTKIHVAIGLVALVFAGVVAYWLISPLFIDREVQESIEDIASVQSGEQAPEQLSSGAFIDADGFHKTSGTATLLKIGEKYYVRFEEDFQTTNGPDLFVHLGKDGEYAASARLGGLRGNIGSQNYEVPEGIDPLAYNEVWIWCRAFSVPFGHAVLQ